MQARKIAVQQLITQADGQKLSKEISGVKTAPQISLAASNLAKRNAHSVSFELAQTWDGTVCIWSFAGHLWDSAVGHNFL
jgi:hypothetical protein